MSRRGNEGRTSTSSDDGTVFGDDRSGSAESGARAAAGTVPAWTAAVALFVVVIVELFTWTTTRVFVLNFSTAGPNATAVLFVLLATGWSLAPVAALDPPRRVVYLGGAALVVVGFLVSLAPSPIVAGFGAILAVTAATPPFVGLCVALRERVVDGVVVGALLVVAGRVALETASPYATTAGIGGLAAVVAALAGLLAFLAHRRQLPRTQWTPVGAVAAPPGALLVVAAGYLAFPHVVARWALRSYELTVVAAVVGLLAGLVVVRSGYRTDRGAPAGWELLGWAVGFLGSIAVLLYWTHPATTAAYALAWTAATVLLAAGAGSAPLTSDAEPAGLQGDSDADPRDGPGAHRSRADRPSGSGAAPLFGLQLLALLVLFCYVSASNWAFMPAPLDTLTRGRASEFLFVFHAVVPLSVLLAARRPTSRDRAGTTSSRSRRSTLGVLLAGTLPLAVLAGTRVGDIGGSADGETADGPETDPDGAAIRVMAYNLHLFFEQGASGRYSLEALADVVREAAPDVLAVSESDGCRPLSGNVDGLQWLGRALGYHTAFGAPSSLRGYGVGLLSRWPLDDVRVVELPVSRSPPRIAVTATVRTPDGPLFVLGTHFMTAKPGDVRDEQARAVVDLATASDHDHAVCLGDFNVLPDRSEPAYRVLEDAMTDAWTAADETSGSPGTYSAADPRERIDHVWLHGEWQVTRAATVGTPRASDHLDVLADVVPDE